jgi:hypothetical protein
MLMTAAVVAVISACSDSNDVQRGLTGPNASATNGPQGSASDTAKNGGTRDSSGVPKPVSRFALTVHVGTPRQGSADTTATNPLANATVSVYEYTLTYGQTAGSSDTTQVNLTLVATGSSDANGNVRFTDLKGKSQYLIKVVPPPGSSLGTVTDFINQAFTDEVKILITLWP